MPLWVVKLSAHCDPNRRKVFYTGYASADTDVEAEQKITRQWRRSSLELLNSIEAIEIRPVKDWGDSDSY